MLYEKPEKPLNKRKKICSRCGEPFTRISKNTKLCPKCGMEFRHKNVKLNSIAIYKERIDKARKLFLPKEEYEKPYYATKSDEIRNIVLTELKKPNVKTISTAKIKKLYPLIPTHNINSVFTHSSTALDMYGIKSERITNYNWKFSLIGEKKKMVKKNDGIKPKTNMEIRDLTKKELALEYSRLKKDYGITKSEMGLLRARLEAQRQSSMEKDLKIRNFRTHLKQFKNKTAYLLDHEYAKPNMIKNIKKE